METNVIITTLLISFLTSGITAWITYSFTVQKIRMEMQLSHKEQKYEKLLVAIRTALYQKADNVNIQSFLDTKIAAYLYASDEVISSIEAVYEIYIQTSSNSLKTNPEDALTKNKNLINAIKKDLG